MHYILLYKPYGVLCQFSSEGGHPTLATCGPFPPDVYPAGRLDADSEGLVLLTNDRRLKHRLTDPAFGHPRIYLVQVEGIPDERALRQLRRGIVLDGKPTRRAVARMLDREPALPPRPVPIRFRKNIPTAWLELILREGRNRQVRRMTAAVGYPTLRLVRSALGPFTLAGLAPGAQRTIPPEEISAFFRSGAPGEQSTP